MLPHQPSRDGSRKYDVTSVARRPAVALTLDGLDYARGRENSPESGRLCLQETHILRFLGNIDPQAFFGRAWSSSRCALPVGFCRHEHEDTPDENRQHLDEGLPSGERAPLRPAIPYRQ